MRRARLRDVCIDAFDPSMRKPATEPAALLFKIVRKNQTWKLQRRPARFADLGVCYDFELRTELPRRIVRRKRTFRTNRCGRPADSFLCPERSLYFYCCSLPRPQLTHNRRSRRSNSSRRRGVKGCMRW